MGTISDAWTRLKARSIAGDFMDTVRSGGLAQGMRKFTSPSSGPVFPLIAFPMLRRSRSEWLATRPKAEASSVGWSPGLLAFRIRSALGRSDVISSEVAAAQVSSRAITPLTNRGPRLRVKSV